MLLSQNSITLGVPIESRVKALQSIIEKEDRKELELESILSLDDFVGIRVILLFKRDIETVTNIFQNKLSVLKLEDKSEDLEEDKFGYQSFHYIVQFPEEWLNVPSLSLFKNFKAEIQVRTLSQHIWAATSHKLQYKKEHNVPPPVRRAINRASALLEVVDLEFERVLKERESYVESLSVQDKLKEDAILDVDILKSISERELPAKNKTGLEDFDDLLSELMKNNINTVGDLMLHLKPSLTFVLKKDKAQSANTLKRKDLLELYSEDEIERLKKGVYYSHVGLIRVSVVHSIGEDDYIRNKKNNE